MPERVAALTTPQLTLDLSTPENCCLMHVSNGVIGAAPAADAPFAAAALGFLWLTSAGTTTELSATASSGLTAAACSVTGVALSAIDTTVDPSGAGRCSTTGDSSDPAEGVSAAAVAATAAGAEPPWGAEAGKGADLTAAAAAPFA